MVELSPQGFGAFEKHQGHLKWLLKHMYVLTLFSVVHLLVVRHSGLPSLHDHVQVGTQSRCPAQLVGSSEVESTIIITNLRSSIV